MGQALLKAARVGTPLRGLAHWPLACQPGPFVLRIFNVMLQIYKRLTIILLGFYY